MACPVAGLARIVLCAVAALVLSTVEAAPKDAASERQLQDLRQRIERLQSDLAAAEKSSGEAADALRESGRAVSEAHRALFELAERRKAIEADLAALSGRRSATRAAITEHEMLAEKLLRLQHRQQAPDRLRLLLEGRDAATLARHITYYGYVQRTRAALIAELRSRAAELADVEGEVVIRRDELAQNEAAQTQEAKRLETEKVARATVATRLAGEISRGRQEIGRLKRDESRLARLVEELARALAARAIEKPRAPAAGTPVDRVADATAASIPFANLKGRLRWPVRGELANRFGAQREEAGSTWKGLFIRSPTGETVRAIADGLVVYADWLRGFGNLLILDHGKGFMSLYANNDGLLRRVGEKVGAGESIASVGASGAQAESGLYFELRREGKPFDPMSWVAQ